MLEKLTIQEFDDDTIKSVNINGISTSSDGDSSVVTVKLDYSVTYEYSYWWLDSDEARSYDGDEELYFSFENTDGEWLQTSLGASYLYY